MLTPTRSVESICYPVMNSDPCPIAVYLGQETVEGLICYTWISVVSSEAMSPKAGLIWEADPFCPGLDQTQGWSQGSPTVPAMPPFDSRRPKSFKCRADFERHYSSGKEAGTCWELRFSGEKQCPTFREREGGGGVYLHITSGITWRLWQQVSGHS